ncbi:hypothetical protein F5Y17DRAFT_451297 [Xylariaceae sp. FL0594]|nr:hypothetical protein F5Y17DRAFT_451297 [Xylariaceae sp. FL0594]
MASLLSIPLEVLLMITSHLTTPEYGNLRATCRHLEASLFGDFAKEFFSKRQFALIEFSIQALVDIAKSRLGPCVTHLIIHLEHPEVTFIRRNFHVRGGVLSPDPAAHNQILVTSLNHSVFISTGLDFELLCEALQHLPNLETIGMRDFNSTRRTRDGTSWNSYGCPTFQALPGAQLGLPQTQPYANSLLRTHEYTNHVFLTILRAMGSCAASGHNPRLTRMEVLLHQCLLLDQAFMIPRHYTAEISAALSKLTTLFLDGLTSEYSDSIFTSDGKPALRIGYFLSRFIVEAPGLKHLRLNFHKYGNVNAEDFLLWLSRPAAGTTMDRTSSVVELGTSSHLPPLFPPPPTLSELEYLDLGMLEVKESTLLSLYSRFKSTLRGISLHRTTLFYEPGPKTNGLASLCLKLASSGFELAEIRLSYIEQLTGPRPGTIFFKDSRNPRIRSWRGSAFSQAVQDIIRDTKISWGKDYLESDDESGR